MAHCRVCIVLLDDVSSLKLRSVITGALQSSLPVNIHYLQKPDCGSSSVLSESLLQQKQLEYTFLEQLLDPRKIQNYVVPVPIGAELRKYQQVFVSYAVSQFVFIVCCAATAELLSSFACLQPCNVTIEMISLWRKNSEVGSSDSRHYKMFTTN